jgi:hypothetical protein
VHDGLAEILHRYWCTAIFFPSLLWQGAFTIIFHFPTVPFSFLYLKSLFPPDHFPAIGFIVLRHQLPRFVSRPVKAIWLVQTLYHWSSLGRVRIGDAMVTCAMGAISRKNGASWNAFLWGHNWMFITVLCILFDIKDYAADHNRQLKTFVVRVGLRRVIYGIVWPLVVTGMVALFAFMLLRTFSLAGMVMNVLPMIALLMVAQSMQQRRPIEYFLVAIDGLMIVKALFGMLSYLML